VLASLITTSGVAMEEGGTGVCDPPQIILEKTIENMRVFSLTKTIYIYIYIYGVPPIIMMASSSATTLRH